MKIVVAKWWRRRYGKRKEDLGMGYEIVIPRNIQTHTHTHISIYIYRLLCSVFHGFAFKCKIAADAQTIKGPSLNDILVPSR